MTNNMENYTAFGTDLLMFGKNNADTIRGNLLCTTQNAQKPKVFGVPNMRTFLSTYGAAAPSGNHQGF